MFLKYIARMGLPTCLCLSIGFTTATAEPLDMLAQQIWESHPSVQTAQARVDATRARADAAGQPLYNPELDLDLEEASARTSSLGIRQTIDWTDKRDARKSIGEIEVIAAKTELALVRQQTLAELLAMLNQYHTASQTTTLAKQQASLLADFLALAKQRFAAGDVAQTDVDLARLALAEIRMQAASRASEVAIAEARLRALVLSPVQAWPPLPPLPEGIPRYETDELLKQHPRLRLLSAQIDAARAGITLAKRERRADPTIGLRGGKEDADALIGINLSLPLFVRNSFRAEVMAANAEAVEAEQTYRNAYLGAQADLKAAVEQFQLSRKALSDWQQTGQSSLQGRVKLLERLWQSGEISTTDYLVQLQQTLNTQISARELSGRAWMSWIAWLNAAGQTESWLGLTENSAR